MADEPLSEINMDPRWRIPPVKGLLEPSFYVPFCLYFSLFQLIGYYVRAYTWNDYTGFKQYRLRNLTVCLIHSSISGGLALLFMILYPNIMFYETIHWYQPWAANLPILSMAYFVCDSFDMIQHEVSRWTVELLVHHSATFVALASSVLPRKFLPYAYWALLMEVNSIFLHIRSLMQITGSSLSNKGIFVIIKIVNILTFVVFRFAVQAWQINWAYDHFSDYHIYYSFIAFVGGGFILLTNIILFGRVLASDGLLGEFGRRHTAITRDTQGSLRILKDTKNS